MAELRRPGRQRSTGQSGVSVSLAGAFRMPIRGAVGFWQVAGGADAGFGGFPAANRPQGRAKGAKVAISQENRGFLPSQTPSGSPHTPSGTSQTSSGSAQTPSGGQHTRLGSHQAPFGSPERRLGVNIRRLGVAICRLGVTRRRLGVNIKRLGAPNVVWASPNFVRESAKGVCGWSGLVRDLPESERRLPNFARVSAPENSSR